MRAATHLIIAVAVCGMGQAGLPRPVLLGSLGAAEAQVRARQLVSRQIVIREL